MYKSNVLLHNKKEVGKQTWKKYYKKQSTGNFLDNNVLNNQ